MAGAGIDGSRPPSRTSSAGSKRERDGDDDDDDTGRRSVSRRLDLAQSAGHAAAAAAVQAGSPTGADDAPMDERDGADDEADRDFLASAFATVGERTADKIFDDLFTFPPKRLNAATRGAQFPHTFFFFLPSRPPFLKSPDIWGVAHCKIPDFPAFDRFTVLSRFEGATFCWKALWIFEDFMGFLA